MLQQIIYSRLVYIILLFCLFVTLCSFVILKKGRFSCRGMLVKENSRREAAKFFLVPSVDEKSDYIIRYHVPLISKKICAR